MLLQVRECLTGTIIKVGVLEEDKQDEENKSFE